MIRKAQVWLFTLKGGVPHTLLFRLVEERGGFWQPITGGVEAGETFRQGALRELHEETTFEVSDSELIDLEHRFHFQGRWGDAEELAFAVEFEFQQSPSLDPIEHTAAEWVSFSDAEKRIPFDSQREALQKLRNLLRLRGKLR